MSSEASKIRQKVLPYLRNRTVLDLGCGDDKIVPWAFGVDNASEWKDPPKGIDLLASVDPADRDLDFLHRRPQGGFYEVVFSSHTLEHLRSPVLHVLRYWLRFVYPVTGRLILYLPDESRYVYNRRNPTVRNPSHLHYLTFGTFRWYLDQLHGVSIERYERDEGEEAYSFLAVVRRGTAEICALT